MKKLTILSATAITVLCLGGQTLTASAAGRNCTLKGLNGNRFVVSYGLGCNIQDILEQLENCAPGITIPETNLPETSLPDTTPPENNNNSNNETTENGVHAYVQQVVNLVNEERAKEGLAPLTIDTKVQAAAQVRAKECEQLFSHTRPNGSSFATALKEQSVSYRSAGENIAWGQRSPQEVVNAWMNSSGHRANIMNANFTTIGVGYYQNANGVNYWCQLFTR